MLEPAGTASDDGDKKKATKTKRAGKNRIAAKAQGVGESWKQRKPAENEGSDRRTIRSSLGGGIDTSIKLCLQLVITVVYCRMI